MMRPIVLMLTLLVSPTRAQSIKTQIDHTPYDQKIHGRTIITEQTWYYADALTEDMRHYCRNPLRNDSTESLREVHDVNTPKQELCECVTRWSNRAAGNWSLSHAACLEQVTRLGDHWNTKLRMADLPRGVSRDCAETLRVRRVRALYKDLGRRCQQDPGHATRLAIYGSQSLQTTPLQDCWRFTSLTREGCLIAQSCTLGGSRLGALGIKGTSENELRKSAVVCNDQIKAAHAVRDPQNKNLDYQSPLVQAHLESPLHAHGDRTCSPSNCHGTADIVADSRFLKDIEVKSIEISEYYDKQCGARYRSYFEKAKGGKAFPTVGDLKLKAGVNVQMNHRECHPRDCGKASLWVDSCDADGVGGAHVYISQMCVECWGGSIEKSGFRAISEPMPRHLFPGCVLTGQDHSLTIVGKFEGLCYWYEAPTGGRPDQLRVHSCSALLARYPRAWCPTSPLAFYEQS